jgi:tyrosine-protein kinase Etk/Wzc
MPHLSILYAGAANPNAQELLATGEFKDLVEIWSREYDFVIVDTPPASASSDGRFLGAVLGASIVVARKDVTSIADLRTLVKELQQSGSSVAGVVLNEI